MIHKTMEIGHEKESVTQKYVKCIKKKLRIQTSFYEIMKPNNNLLHAVVAVC